MPEQTGDQQVANICANCKDALTSYFAITYVGRDGKPRPQSVRVCSIRCLIGWAYRYVAQQGVKGVMMAKSVIDRITQTMKGA